EGKVVSTVEVVAFLRYGRRGITSLCANRLADGLLVRLVHRAGLHIDPNAPRDLCSSCRGTADEDEHGNRRKEHTVPKGRERRRVEHGEPPRGREADDARRRRGLSDRRSAIIWPHRNSCCVMAELALAPPTTRQP